MKKMILLAAVFPLLFSCSKDPVEVNYLPGKWNLVQSAFYENDSLKAISQSDDVNTVYYFSSCETSTGSACDMYVEEDGEQQYYEYIFDERSGTLLLGETSVFQVAHITSTELQLVRDY